MSMQLAALGYLPLVLAVTAAGGVAFGASTRRRTIRRQQDELTRLRQSVQRRAEQVAALSHELRTPLTLDTPQVTREISADPALVLQALTNLLSNASRYTSDGGSISVRVMEVDGGVAVYVTDDGRGMTREERRRLFHRFVTGRPLEDGTGLGLVITKDIVEAHGGTILVDTTAHRGTTFLVTMPTAPMPTVESR